MLYRTHFAITALAILIFIPYVNNEIVFVLVALISTLLPDLDSPKSLLGRKKVGKATQLVVEHRGLFHSFTFLLLITLVFALFIPSIALPFFLAYSLHLFADSFTHEGIKPFYPLKKDVKGNIRTGGRMEFSILVSILIIDIVLFIVRLYELTG